MKVNPFTYGNPISDSTRFFGRRWAVEQLFSRLRNAEFESSSIVGERRIGKTSLLNYMTDADVRRSHGLDPDKHIFVYVDLQMVDKDMTPTRLWLRLLRQMAKYNQDVEIKQTLNGIRTAELIDTFTLADVFGSIAEKGLHIVFLLDEFEHVTENQNFGPDFFYGLRSLATQRTLSLITSSRRELIDLCHSDIIRASPFFNIFANINLRLFTEDEAREFILHSLAGTDAHFTDEELSVIFRFAGYHPYFLQVACFFLFEAWSRNLGPGERITFLDHAFREEATPHLDDYWHNSGDQEKIVLTVLALLEQQQRKVGKYTFSLKELQDLYTHSPQTLLHLEKRGLLTSMSDKYALFSASFGEWICREITDTIHDQQKYEDWLASSKSVMERLSGRGKNELSEILPKISSKYRELIITWVSDPRNLITAAGLLKAVLGLL